MTVTRRALRRRSRHGSAVRRLAGARAERSRADLHYAAAFGTPGELAAGDRLADARVDVAASREWLHWVATGESSAPWADGVWAPEQAIAAGPDDSELAAVGHFDESRALEAWADDGGATHAPRAPGRPEPGVPLSAGDRDDLACHRDGLAVERDRVAAVRDRLALAHDAEQRNTHGGRGAGERQAAARQRAAAATDRENAASDRRLAAADRARSAAARPPVSRAGRRRTSGSSASSLSALRRARADARRETVVERVLASHPTAASRARHAVLELRLPAEARESIELIVTELVTNAFRHTGATYSDAIHLRMAHHGSRVHIRVHDNGPGFAAAEIVDTGLFTPGGLGFVLVDALSEGWAVDCDAAGCTVSCEVEATVVPAAAFDRGVTQGYVLDLAVDMTRPNRPAEPVP